MSTLPPLSPEKIPVRDFGTRFEEKFEQWARDPRVLNFLGASLNFSTESRINARTFLKEVSTATSRTLSISKVHLRAQLSHLAKLRTFTPARGIEDER